MELVRLADGALYWAKAHGRNRSIRYSPEVVEELSAGERAVRLEHQQALNAVLALARAVDAKDPYTMLHSERVADMAVRLALELGWSADRRAAAARGRGAARRGQDRRAGRSCSPSPAASPRRSSTSCASTRRAAPRSWPDGLSAEQVGWVRGHHERFDGRGYPDGLAGQAIPDGARLLALADAWDAMTSDRPYRPGLAPARALEICREEYRAQFAPECVNALLRLWESGAVSDLAPDDGDPLERARMQYRGAAATTVSRRRDRPTVSGSGLVYRGQTISGEEPGPA